VNPLPACDLPALFKKETQVTVRNTTGEFHPAAIGV